MTIILIVLFLIWVYSYFKFRRKYKYFLVMTEYLKHELLLNQGNVYSASNVMLRLSSAFIEIQHYKDAYEVYETLMKTDLPNIDKSKLKENMDFCNNPFPGSNGLKNHNGSFWHNFILVRLGKRRFNFLTEEDFLQTNSIMRNM